MMREKRKLCFHLHPISEIKKPAHLRSSGLLIFPCTGCLPTANPEWQLLHWFIILIMALVYGAGDSDNTWAAPIFIDSCHQTAVLLLISNCRGRAKASGVSPTTAPNIQKRSKLKFHIGWQQRRPQIGFFPLDETFVAVVSVRRRRRQWARRRNVST